MSVVGAVQIGSWWKKKMNLEANTEPGRTILFLLPCCTQNGQKLTLADPHTCSHARPTRRRRTQKWPTDRPSHPLQTHKYNARFRPRQITTRTWTTHAIFSIYINCLRLRNSAGRPGEGEGREEPFCNSLTGSKNFWSVTNHRPYLSTPQMSTFAQTHTCLSLGSIPSQHGRSVGGSFRRRRTQDGRTKTTRFLWRESHSE